MSASSRWFYSTVAGRRVRVEDDQTASSHLLFILCMPEAWRHRERRELVVSPIDTASCQIERRKAGWMLVASQTSLP